MKTNLTSFRYFISVLISLAGAAHADDLPHSAPEAVGVHATPADSVHNAAVSAGLAGTAAALAVFDKMNAKPDSKWPKPAGTMKTPPATLEQYLESLPHSPGSVELARGQYAPPAGACDDFSQLTFAGIQFIGNARCVKATSDEEASVACQGARYINPNNPQYGVNQAAVTDYNRTHNPNGYYYCVPYDSRNSKQTMCQSIAPLRFPSMQFDWVPTAGNRDGYCTCSATGAPTTRDLCNNADEIAAQARQVTTPTACQGNPNVEPGQPILASQIPGRTPATHSEGTYCRCSQSSPARGTYVKTPIQADSCGAGAAVQASSAPVNSEFNRCLADYREKAMRCDRESKRARNTCREKIQNAQNSPLNIAGNVVGALGQVGIAANAGSGNQQNCFGAGVGMMGVREALRQGRDTCEAEFGSCQQSCAEEIYERMLTECPAKLRNPENNNEPMTQAQLLQRGDENAQAFERTRSELQPMFTEGRRVCAQDAGGANQDMSRLMSGLGNSIQQSMVCACNLSNGSNASTNCNQIPTIQSCESNPNLPNCQVYSGVDTCNPASAGYNQQMCNCVQNPTNCTNVSGTPPPSMFGGNLKNPIGPSGPNGFAGNLAGGGGGGGRGSYDLGGEAGGEAQVALAGPQFSGGAKGGGGGMGFGGGGGGGSAGGADGEPAVKGEVQEKGLAGLFNQAKTALKGALGFGGGKAGTTKLANGKPTKKEDLTKFKPRNLASAGRNGIGTANMDIFGMIKMCAQGETCETNRPKSAWILTP